MTNGMPRNAHLHGHDKEGRREYDVAQKRRVIYFMMLLTILDSFFASYEKDIASRIYKYRGNGGYFHWRPLT